MIFRWELYDSLSPSSVITYLRKELYRYVARGQYRLSQPSFIPLAHLSCGYLCWSNPNFPAQGRFTNSPAGTPQGTVSSAFAPSHLSNVTPRVLIGSPDPNLAIQSSSVKRGPFTSEYSSPNYLTSFLRRKPKSSMSAICSGGQEKKWTTATRRFLWIMKCGEFRLFQFWEYKMCDRPCASSVNWWHRKSVV